MAGEIAEIGYDEPDDVTKTLDRGRVDGLRGRRAPRRRLDPRRCRDLLDEAIDDLEPLYERGDAITGVPTGYHDLDELLSGLQPSTR